MTFPFPFYRGPSTVPLANPTTLANFASSSVNTATPTTTTSAAIIAGQTVVIVVSLNPTANVTVSSVSDGTNSYTKATSVYRTAGQGIEIWYKTSATAVGSGATITISLTGSTGAGGVVQIQALQFQGATALDVVATNSGIGATFTATTATLAQAAEMAIGASLNFSVAPYVVGTGFTNLITNTTAGSSAVDYKITSSTTAIAFNPTWTGAAGGMCVAVATFK